MKRILPLLLCLLLTSCGSVISDTDALLHPPTLNRQQAEVYDALESALNVGDIVYKYPLRGQYRTPFVFFDLDGSGQDEAVVFYAYASNQTSSTRAMVLRYDEERGWSAFHDFSLGSEQVDFVEFAHLLSPASVCMIVGLQNPAIQGGRAVESALSIFSLSGDSFNTEIKGRQYIDYLIQDFDGDRLDELVAVERTERQELRISLLRSAGSHIDVTATLPLCYNADVLLGAATGELWDGGGAIYLDEILINQSYATEVVRIDADGMVILAGGNQISTPNDEVPAWENYTDTFRDSPVRSWDYDGDGKVEVPYLRAMPGGQYDEENQLWISDLMQLTESGFDIRSRAVINEREQYLVFLPDKWMSELGSLVTVVRDDEAGRWQFYQVNPETGETGGELLRIWADYGTAQTGAVSGEEIELDTRGTRRYYGYIPLSPDPATAITDTELREMFRLYD